MVVVTVTPSEYVTCIRYFPDCRERDRVSFGGNESSLFHVFLATPLAELETQNQPLYLPYIILNWPRGCHVAQIILFITFTYMPLSLTLILPPWDSCDAPLDLPMVSDTWLMLQLWLFIVPIFFYHKICFHLLPIQAFLWVKLPSNVPISSKHRFMNKNMTHILLNVCCFGRKDDCKHQKWNRTL